MGAENDILYRFAYDDSNRVVSIKDINESNRRQNFVCPHCHSKMYPALGNIRVHHFRHIGDPCQHDGYLHSTAEEVFLEEYQKCLDAGIPFILEDSEPLHCERLCINKKIDSTCRIRTMPYEYDLTAIFSSVSRETRVIIDDHYRRPDILLSSDSGDQLWIEIWVSHETEDDKRADGDIIEIKVSDEIDIEMFHRHKLSTVAKGKKVRLHFDLGKYYDLMESSYSTDDCERFSQKAIHQPQKRKIVVPHKQSPEAFPVINTRDIEWVDLGLPSGTLWAKNDSLESVPFQAIHTAFYSFLPTQKQAYELYNYCSREASSSGKQLVFTGPNGNSIAFPLVKPYTAFWIKPGYKENGDYANCFRILGDKRFFVNDDDDEKPGNVRCTWP